ncbi:MAG: hypothetical protein Ct9H90mP17_2580 [Actinomycetota bacterium]|nr:MAG: hypothetical protein Ct9H90mP17_2580 [Actinomycetota bacterium]
MDKTYIPIFWNRAICYGCWNIHGSGLGPGPRDGIMTGIAKRGPSVRATRIGIDFTAFLNWVLLGGSYGYGTIFMVIVVGPIVQFSLKRYDKGAIFSL